MPDVTLETDSNHVHNVPYMNDPTVTINNSKNVTYNSTGPYQNSSAALHTSRDRSHPDLSLATDRLSVCRGSLNPASSLRPHRPESVCHPGHASSTPALGSAEHVAKGRWTSLLGKRARADYIEMQPMLTARESESSLLNEACDSLHNSSGSRSLSSPCFTSGFLDLPDCQDAAADKHDATGNNFTSGYCSPAQLSPVATPLHHVVNVYSEGC